MLVLRALQEALRRALAAQVLQGLYNLRSSIQAARQHVCAAERPTVKQRPHMRSAL